MTKQIKVGSDQESERNSQSKNQGWKNKVDNQINIIQIQYLYQCNFTIWLTTYLSGK